MPRRNAFYFFEDAHKIIDISKTTLQPGLCNGLICTGE